MEEFVEGNSWRGLTSAQLHSPSAKLAGSVRGPLKRINLFCSSLSDRERNVIRPEANPPHTGLPQSAQVSDILRF